MEILTLLAIELPFLGTMALPPTYGKSVEEFYEIPLTCWLNP